MRNPGRVPMLIMPTAKAHELRQQPNKCLLRIPAHGLNHIPIIFETNYEVFLRKE